MTDIEHRRRLPVTRGRREWVAIDSDGYPSTGAQIQTFDRAADDP